MNAYTPYIEFFPTYVDAVKFEVRQRGENIKSGHAHELASAFFGFKTYAAFKASDLNNAISPPKTLPDESESLLSDRWQKLEDKLSFTVDDDITRAVYNRLALFYNYEASRQGGAFLRALRQMKKNFDYERNLIMHSIYLDMEDITVFGDLAVGMDSFTERLYGLQEPEIFYICQGITALENPITSRFLENEMKPSIILGDPLANIIEFNTPGLFYQFIFDLK